MRAVVEKLKLKTLVKQHKNSRIEKYEITQRGYFHNPRGVIEDFIDRGDIDV